MTHYATSIEEIGPIRQYWSMAFEARHKFFKTSAHALGNFKNITKSLAYRFQINRSFNLIKTDVFSPNSFECSDYEYADINNTVFSDKLQDRFSKSAKDKIKISNMIKHNGSEFKK